MDVKEVIAKFIRSLVNGSVDDRVVNEIMKISTAIVSIMLYGIVSTMKNGVSTRFSVITALSRTFTVSFMRDVFEVLIASSSNNDDAIDAAGLISTAYLIKTLFEHEPEKPRPGFISPIMIKHEVYVMIYNNVKEYVEDYETRNSVAFGIVGNVIALLGTIFMLMFIVGMCQGIKSEGYPLGIRDFLSYALTDTTQMAVSEMLSS